MYKQVARKFCSFITICAMCITILPGTAWADGGTGGSGPSETTIASGTTGQVGKCDGTAVTVYVPETADPLTNVNVETPVNEIKDTTNTLDAGWYIVNSDITNNNRITVNGDVHLILAQGATLNAEAGITVQDDNKLTIWGQNAESTGTLTATSTTNNAQNFNAGIGGTGSQAGNGVAGGTITINGGTVEGTCQATGTGYSYGAGIGGGYLGEGGNITINGGNVTGTCQATGTGYSYGAGIGGGNHGAGGTITINGGTVEGTSSGLKESDGAGIGGGLSGEGGHIIVNGGTVEGTCQATGKEGFSNGAGIGGGHSGAGGTITINGGNVTGACQSTGENGKSYGAGIGGGDGKSGGTITINGGTVKGTSSGLTESHGAGIGGGLSGEGGHIIVNGGTVEGTCQTTEENGGFSCGAGIGGGHSGVGGTIEINGGTVEGTCQATGKGGFSDGAGIGNGRSGAGGTFSTGAAGNAVIFASGATAISDTTRKPNDWSGVIFEGNAGAVYGTPTIQTNATIPSEKTLTVGEGKTLTIRENVILTNQGTITNNGTIRKAPAKKVTFNIVNGTLSGSNDTKKIVEVYQEADKIEFSNVEVKFNDAKLTEDQIPTGMQANDGYEGGAWDPVLDVTQSITGDCSFTYTFTEKPPYIPPYNPDKTETITNPDGSTTTVVTKPDGTKTTTTEQPNGDKVSETKKPDGTTITIEEKANGDKTTETKQPDGTQIIETEKANGDKQKEIKNSDGSGTIAISKADGSQSTTTIDKNGQQETKAVVSEQAVEDAAKVNKPVITPTPAMEAAEVDEGELAPVLNITVPKTVTEEQPLTIVVPVKNLAPSDVLVLVHPDGTEEIVRKSIGTKDGIKMQITGNVQLKLVNNAQAFSDTKDHWAEEAIQIVTARGIFNGVGGGQFAPDVTTNRAMLVTVLHNLESNPEQTFDGNFNDVDDSAWYAESVKWAAETGIVSGVGNNNFAPEDTLTREQMVTMLYRYAGSPVVDSNAADQYSDSANISDYAKDAMTWAISKGIINGVGNNTLDPQGQATRAQLAIVITKLMQL